MSSSRSTALGSTDSFPRLLYLAGLWSSRPRWVELQYAIGLATGDAAQLGKEREELSDFVERGFPPEAIRIQRGIIAHQVEQQVSSSRQLLRWLDELTELHNLTQEHVPDLLGYIPDMHQFTGRKDRPPPSDATCEAYAGQVRTLLGHLIAEQRRPSRAAVVTSHGTTGEGHAAGEKPAPGGTSVAPKKGRGKHIDAQMLKMISEDASRCDWTAREWATRLGCSEGTVKGTNAWKHAIKLRKYHDADRIVRTGERKDRRRNGRT